MTPRPRKASDEQIFGAAYRVIERLGPTQWTLADVAGEAGLTAGALVQRFGSKHALMVELTAQLAAATRDMFAGLRARHRSPLATVRAYGDCIAGMAPTPGALAHHLSYLQRDITDPQLHEQVRKQARSTRAELKRLLDEAVAAGELVNGADTRTLARSIEVTVSGSLLTWGVYQEGTALSWIRRDLTVLLQPFRPSKKRMTKRAAK